jgi:Protein of unknown function with HXXEE motif
MAMGGVSVLAASRKKPIELRTLAVMNSVTMAAHQVEEYVDPGYFPGQVNAGIFKSDQPRNYPFNARSAAIANASFTLLYLAPVVFPKTKWLGLPAAILGIGQAFAHWIMMPIRLRTKYAPGGFNAILLQVPIGIAYFQAVRAQGPIERSDWAKSAGVGAVFIIVGVAAPNVLGADKNSPYAFSDKQTGPYLENADAADKSTAESSPNA